MDIDYKAMSPDQKQIAILAEMNRGAKANDLAVKYDVNPMTIGSWRRKARKAAEKDALQELADVDPVVVETVLQEVRAKSEVSDTITPTQAKNLDKSLSKLGDGLVGLDMIDTQIQATMLKALKWADRKITDDMKTSEWSQVIDGITKIHGTLHHKANNTQVNIQNNAELSDTKLDTFKSEMRL